MQERQWSLAHQNTVHVYEFLRASGILVANGDVLCEGCVLGNFGKVRNRETYHTRTAKPEKPVEIINGYYVDQRKILILVVVVIVLC